MRTAALWPGAPPVGAKAQGEEGGHELRKRAQEGRVCGMSQKARLHLGLGGPQGTRRRCGSLPLGPDTHSTIACKGARQQRDSSFTFF